MGDEADRLNEMYDGYDASFNLRDEEAMWDRYHDAEKAKVGTVIRCATCDMPFVKKSYQSKFCSNKGRQNCKDKFWNTVDEERRHRWGYD